MQTPPVVAQARATLDGAEPESRARVNLLALQATRDFLNTRNALVDTVVRIEMAHARLLAAPTEAHAVALKVETNHYDMHVMGYDLYKRRMIASPEFAALYELYKDQPVEALLDTL